MAPPRGEMRVEECPQCRKRRMVGVDPLALMRNETVVGVVCAECVGRNVRYPKKVRRRRRERVF